MQQETESCVLDEDPLAVSNEKSENKSSHVRAIHPSKDLNRYIVDKFHQPTAKSKAAPFEAIDLSIYKPSARCLAFSTSEDRLLLWIVAFQFRYYEITGNGTDYTVIWEEQDNPSSTSKCDKICIHLSMNTSTGEEKLVTITVFGTTGRILVQGKKYDEWSKFEFPVILKIVNTLSDLQPLSSLSSVGDVSLFGASLQNFFTNFITFVRDDDIPSSNNLDAELPSTTKPEALLPTETLTISPTRLKTISSMRDTLGQLEADFTEFHMTTTGDLEQLKDKTVKQDHLIKLQKQSSDDLLNDFSSQITSLQKIVSQQSSIIKKLQDENQILHKKHVQIDKANQALQESQNNLMTEINFLKEQMTALWQNSKEADLPSPSS